MVATAIATSTILQVEQVSKAFGDFQALTSVSLDLQRGEILGLLGPSGCGKTTLLRLIAGLERPDSGRMIMGDRIISDTHTYIPPEHRRLGMVFQDFALFPHLTIAQNIAFGLQQQRLKPSIIREQVAAVLGLVRLQGLEKRYPHELSGGQQQRVALARALAPQPDLILLDEPLSNLDAQVRLELREELRAILKRAGITTIFVTHDQEEALSMSDRLAVMRQGKVEQLGTPEDIYRYPASRFVAGFVSQANFIPAAVEGDLLQTDVGAFCLLTEAPGQRGEVMIREEDMVLEANEETGLIIADRQFLGREYRYCLATPSGQELHARLPVEFSFPVGTSVQISAAADAVRFFPVD
ncbi:ABC transporter ATP-binding protein [Candidatus Synechococcus calcipolaris G9]|uniref:ABC transporter ATP-binding protein n=1 Tax=Candidatus Synechococcus calcipolaris G9 TaxID=1497997 RepID=A0ABT6F1E2_9SYNE|nr:ABC transporter ATP-binding protein [Candidatus Synechococcus calcipolaris]MDG2991686.1 ABC transporter ATP-binding protein [Candidatus Synechococcus calcipolaris G9]